MNYIPFIKQNAVLITFGILMTSFSSFGQTFLLAMYVPFLMEDFDLSNGEISTFYAIATIGSAMILPYFGKFIDTIDLRQYTLIATVLFILALGFTGFITVWWLLPIAFFGLRFAGQGLFTHISITSMSRYFDEGRGKAISLATLGHPIGQAILPLLVLGMISWVGWRESLWLNATAIGLIVPIFLYFLIKDRHLVIPETNQITKVKTDTKIDRVRQRDILKSKSFWLLAPNMFFLSFTITGLFFYQFAITDFKGWNLEWMAGGLTAYAIASSISILVAGPLIDKYSARRFFPFYLIPFFVAVVCIWLMQSPWVVFPYMILMGISGGFGGATVAALQVEFFGATYIGTVRSMFTSLMVLSSAFGPALYGYLLDFGMDFNFIFIITLLMLLAVIIQSFRAISPFAFKRFKYKVKKKFGKNKKPNLGY